MNKYHYFYNFCKCYQIQIDSEKHLRQIGIELNEGSFLNNIDSLISMIPELLFNAEGVEVFWNLLCLDYKFTDEYIEQLWEELKEFQL